MPRLSLPCKRSCDEDRHALRFWSFCLLTLLQLLAGVVVSMFLRAMFGDLISLRFWVKAFRFGAAARRDFVMRFGVT